MSILSRFSDIMSANINAMLDKFEDPGKMVDQILRDLNGDILKVKNETASIIAEEARAKRELDECNSEIDKLLKYAEKAINAGNDGDARIFLAKKGELANTQGAISTKYQICVENSSKMKDMHNKLEEQISQLNNRRNEIKAKATTAKMQGKLNDIQGKIGGVGANLSAFDRMEDKVNKMMDEANAMAELNKPKEDSTQALFNKYDSPTTDVEDELQRLKAKMSK